MKDFPKIGLTGQLGSGKTTVIQIWQEFYSFRYLSLDEIGHEVVASLRPRIVNEICSGKDFATRRKLAEIVFSHPSLYQKFMALISPLMRETVWERIQGKGPLVLEGALIFEYQLEKFFNRLVLVKAPLKEKLRRFCQKTEYSLDLARAILKTQLPDKIKIPQVDFVIDNSQDLSSLREKAKEVGKHLFR
jgi:dephospho-CoA kinase